MLAVTCNMLPDNALRDLEFLRTGYVYAYIHIITYSLVKLYYQSLEGVALPPASQEGSLDG